MIFSADFLDDSEELLLFRTIKFSFKSFLKRLTSAIRVKTTELFRRFRDLEKKVLFANRYICLTIADPQEYFKVLVSADHYLSVPI